MPQPKPKPKPTSEFLAPREVAGKWNVSDRHIRKLITRGEFPGAIRLGTARSSPLRIPVRDVEVFEARSRLNQN